MKTNKPLTAQMLHLTYQPDVYDVLTYLPPIDGSEIIAIESSTQRSQFTEGVGHRSKVLKISLRQNPSFIPSKLVDLKCIFSIKFDVPSFFLLSFSLHL